MKQTEEINDINLAKYVLVSDSDGNDRTELGSTTIEDASIEALETLGYTVLEV